MFCVFGVSVDWNMVSKQILSCGNISKVVAYTEFRPENLPECITTIQWEEFDYRTPEDSYATHTCFHEYIKHCIEKIQEMTKINNNAKIVYMFENTIYFDYEKDIIISEELEKYFHNIPYTESFRILSDTHIRIKNNDKRFSDLDSDLRKNIFEKLYNGRVVDFKNFIPDSKEFENKKIFFIMSVINIIQFSRSYYTINERLEQTKRQLKSIKEQTTDSMTLLLETTTLTFSQMEALKPDYIILFDKDSDTYHYAHIHSSKHITEAHILTRIVPLFEKINYSHFCKFTGRYYLHKSFVEKDFFKEICTLRRIKVGLDQVHPIIDSIFYIVPKKYEKNMTNILSRCAAVIEQLYLDIERTMEVESQRENIPINYVTNIKVSGFAAQSAEANWI